MPLAVLAIKRRSQRGTSGGKTNVHAKSIKHWKLQELRHFKQETELRLDILDHVPDLQFQYDCVATAD